MIDEAYNVHRGRTSRERAEQTALDRAQKDYEKSAASGHVAELGTRVLLLENFIRALRGEEGIDNEGPIFRLSRRPIPIAPEAFTGVTLTFCGPDDVQHTGDFHVKNVAPPL